MESHWTEQSTFCGDLKSKLIYFTVTMSSLPKTYYFSIEDQNSKTMEELERGWKDEPHAAFSGPAGQSASLHEAREKSSGI